MGCVKGGRQYGFIGCVQRRVGSMGHVKGRWQYGLMAFVKGRLGSMDEWIGVKGRVGSMDKWILSRVGWAVWINGLCQG